MIKGGFSPVKGTAGSRSAPFFGLKRKEKKKEREMYIPVGIIKVGFSTAREQSIL